MREHRPNSPRGVAASPEPEHLPSAPSCFDRSTLSGAAGAGRAGVAAKAVAGLLDRRRRRTRARRGRLPLQEGDSPGGGARALRGARERRQPLPASRERAAGRDRPGALRRPALGVRDLRPRAVPASGDNLVAATVWNFGSLSPMAQMSRRTGFLVQGDDEASAALDTGPDVGSRFRSRPRAESRRSRRDSRAALLLRGGPGRAARGGPLGLAVGPSRLACSARWKPARAIGRGHPNTIREGPGWMQTPEGWLLEPSPLPPMEHREIAGGRVVRTRGIAEPGAFPAAALVVPPRSEVRLLLDQGEIVNAYPELRTSGGEGAVVRLTYAEALYDEQGTEGKPQRDRGEGDRRRLRRARRGRRDRDAASRRCGGARGASSSSTSGPARTP